jgi:hypothetical protein
LTLRRVPLLEGDVYRAVGAAEIPDLALDGCRLEDGGATLVESVSMGRGSNGLSIARHLFDSLERSISFVSALRGNTYVERLELKYFHTFRDGATQALAPALRENKGLANLATLVECCFDNLSWSELMAAVSTHDDSLSVPSRKGSRSLFSEG